MRFFNTTGSVVPGKTSVLLAVRDLLNSGEADDYCCVYVNVEPGGAMRENLPCFHDLR